MNTHQPTPPADAGPAPDGGALSPADAAREARRAQRLAVLDLVGMMNIQAAERLTQYITGQLSDAEESEPFRRLPDPVMALARLTRSIRRTVLLQERLDEDNEAREQRLAAEKAAGRPSGSRGASITNSARPKANGHGPP